jgi:predicted nucleic acid-binding protein
MHSVAVAAGDSVRRRGDTPCVFAQVLYEFWVVATRPPGENGLGFSVARVTQEILRFKPPFFQLFHDKAEVFGEWQRLVQEHEVKGKDAHDARLVAAMNTHGVRGILTFNTKDFRRYLDIKVLDPHELASTAPR